MDINIIAAMEAAELVLERMSLEKGGRGGLLVNTASLAGQSLSLSSMSLSLSLSSMPLLNWKIGAG